MSTQPRLSIITVTYNAANVLPITLYSTAAQRWKAWEHIFVDGGSRDETLALIEQYAKNIPSVRWISEKDSGIYDAMNKGLQMAQGEYVVFLNAGDSFWAEDTLERLFSEAPPEADILYGDHRYVTTEGVVLARRRARPYPRGELTLRAFRTGMGIAHQALFVRRAIAPLYDLRYPLAGDLDWVIRLLRKKPRSYDSRMILIRFLEGGVSTRKKRQYIWERTKILYRHFGVGAVVGSGWAMFLNLLRRGYPPGA